MITLARQQRSTSCEVLRCAPLFALLFGLRSAPAAPDTQVRFEQSIDKLTTLSLEDTKLSAVLEKITEQTGVRIVIPRDVLDLIPSGGDTMVRQITVTNAPLRKTLNDLFAPLGMSFSVGDGQVDIVPHDALRRLGRPPTWPELDTLAELRSMHPGVDQEALGRLRLRVQFQTGAPSSWTALAEAISDVGAGSGDAVLTFACAQLGWAWTLSGGEIVVSRAEDQIASQLRQLVSLRVNHRPLIDALHALGKRVDVEMRTEPGVLASLPLPVQKNFSINVHRRSAQQVLEEVCAYTGLAFAVNADGVSLYWPAEGTGPIGEYGPVPVGAQDPYVAKITSKQTKDGKVLEWLYRRSELDEGLREMREQDLKELIETVKKAKEKP